MLGYNIRVQKPDEPFYTKSGSYQILADGELLVEDSTATIYLTPYVYETLQKNQRLDLD